MNTNKEKTITLTLVEVKELIRKYRQVHQRPDLFLGDARIAHDYLVKIMKENYPEELDTKFGFYPDLKIDTPDSYPTFEEFLKGVPDWNKRGEKHLEENTGKVTSRAPTSFHRLDYLLFTPYNSNDANEIHKLLNQAFEILLKESIKIGKISMQSTIEDFKTWIKKQVY